MAARLSGRSAKSRRCPRSHGTQPDRRLLPWPCSTASSAVAAIAFFLPPALRFRPHPQSAPNGIGS
jgi:hypothetical protein